jgi:subtilisin-like proprotein convertase family protein
MKKHYFSLFVFVVFTMGMSAQTKESVQQIIEKYDINKIKETREVLKKAQRADKLKAITIAKQKNWPEFVRNSNGTIDELMRVTPDGFPIYYTNNNGAAAKSTRANHLNTGGSLGLDLNGQGMVARVWDGGTVRRTHNFLSTKITTVDDVSGTTYGDHPTHVTGTIVAAGLAATRGMAYQATARTFNWTDDESEALTEVLGGMLLSNHSYGVPVTNGNGVALPGYYIGAYDFDAKNWDEIAYLSPYYLAVVSAGNDGLNDDNASPIAVGYDKLVGNKNAKNNLVVANANDASVNVNGTLAAPVSINTGSSQGPTDDRRIKPDITGNGTDVTSCLGTSNSSMGSMTGTSMAAPNVTGTLLLVQQHYKNVTNGYLRAATLKGLACHTADDGGAVGPDPKYGWGLLNAKKAVETINGNGLTSWVSENTLSQGQTYTMNVKADGVNPLMASITWTDVPGTPGTGIVNDPTPILVNDLDIRITRNATTYFPWKLNNDVTLAAVRTGDNNVDNVEQIKIDAPVAGDYTITVTHKGNLVGGKQNYALVVTGVTSSFAITSTSSSDLTVCNTQNAVFTYNYKQTGSFTTNFTAVGLPAGASAVISPTSLNANGTITMTVSGLTNATPGEYNVGISGTNGIETEVRPSSVRIYSNIFQLLPLTAPTNGQDGVALTTTLDWSADVNAESYKLEVSTNAGFSTIFATTTTAETKYLLTGLSEGTTYYWRVIPINRCGQASTKSEASVAAVTTNSFVTGVLDCGNVFMATDFTNAHISELVNSEASVSVNVTGGLTIGDLNIILGINHTYVADMEISLEGPAAIGSPIITLFDNPCTGDYDDMNCIVDDSGAAPVCTTTPAVMGNIKPLQALNRFNDLPADGVWTLHVLDVGPQDPGDIVSFGISICKVSPLGVNENAFAEAKIYPNPTNGRLNIDLGTSIDGETTLSLYDIQGRQMMTKKMNSTSDVLNVQNFQNGVYLLSVENGNKKMTRKVVLNK